MASEDNSENHQPYKLSKVKESILPHSKFNNRGKIIKMC
jgi:hypothetical protein